MAITVDNGELTDFDVSVGAGAVDANTQRVTLASDDPAVASLAAIEAAVGGGLTDTELRATPVPVSGTVTASGPLTDAELRAVAVPVSGTVTANLSATDNAVLDAIAASVAGTLAVDLGVNNDVTVTGTVDLGATDNAVLDAIAASLALLDNSIAAGNELQVDVVAALPAGTNNIGDVDVLSLPALVAGSANIGDVDVLTVPTDPFGANADAASATGSISAKLRGIATALGVTALDLGSGTGGSRTLRSFQDTAQWVGGTGVDSSAVQRMSLATNVALPAGTNNIGDVDVLSLPASTNTLEVVGDAAHDAALAGNPVRIGARGVSADPAVITTGRTVDLLASLLGKQIVLPFSHPGASETYASAAAVTDTADDEAFAAVASTRHYITSVQVFNADATVGTEVVIKDGSTVKWRGYAAALGGGCSAVFATPLRGTANTAINVANITTSAETYFNLQGYQATE